MFWVVLGDEMHVSPIKIDKLIPRIFYKPFLTFSRTLGIAHSAERRAAAILSGVVYVASRCRRLTLFHVLCASYASTHGHPRSMGG